jgi:glycosyltransferase involved in cell wall biosynthesis
MPKRTGSPDPLCSVVIPTRNRAALLRSAIESVAGEDGIELIVVKSHDDRQAELAVEAARTRATVVVTPGERAAARNYGLQLARGKYVLFLDDDDMLAPGAPAALVSVAMAHDASVVRGKRMPIGPRAGHSVLAPVTRSARIRRIRMAALYTGEQILTPSQTLFERRALDRLSFREAFVPVEDYVLGAELSLLGARVLATSMVTTGYRIHTGQSVHAYGIEHHVYQLRSARRWLETQRPAGRRLRRRMWAHHYLHTEPMLGATNRSANDVLVAAARAAVWWPPLVVTPVWLRTAAFALRLASRSR